MASSATTHPNGLSQASSASKSASISGLPASVASPQIPTVHFTTVEELFEQIDHVPGDILIAEDVSSQDFTAIEKKSEVRGRKYRFRRYYADSRTLIIMITTGIHEQLHAELYELYLDNVRDICLRRSWITRAAQTYRPGQGHPGGDGGQGDSSGGPRPERVGREQWPTLVIEAGYSQSLTQLRADIEWWFAASNHDVKIVILAKFDHRQRQIILERWEEGPRQAPSGATTTRSATTLEPVLRQSITITRNPTDPITYDVVSSPLVLGFRLLFLREPGPLEGDIVITDADLQHYAYCVWTEVYD